MLEFLNFLTKSKNTNIATRLFQIENIATPIQQIGCWYSRKYKDTYTNPYIDESFCFYYGIKILTAYYNINNRYRDNNIEKAVLNNKKMIKTVIDNNTILKNFIEKGE